MSVTLYYPKDKHCTLPIKAGCQQDSPEILLLGLSRNNILAVLPGQ